MPKGFVIPPHIRSHLDWHIRYSAFRYWVHVLLIGLSWLQVPSHFPQAVAFHHYSAAVNLDYPLVRVTGRPLVGRFACNTDDGSSSSTGSSSSAGGRWPSVMSSKRWPENSSKLTSFVHSSASTNRQTCLSSRAAGLSRRFQEGQANCFFAQRPYVFLDGVLVFGQCF